MRMQGWFRTKGGWVWASRGWVTCMFLLRSRMNGLLHGVIFFILGGVLVLIWEQIGQKVQTIWKNSGVGYGQRREPFWEMFALKNMWV